MLVNVRVAPHLTTGFVVREILRREELVVHGLHGCRKELALRPIAFPVWAVWRYSIVLDPRFGIHHFGGAPHEQETGNDGQADEGGGGTIGGLGDWVIG